MTKKSQEYQEITVKSVGRTAKNISEDYKITVNFDSKKYSTIQDWLDDSINQFMYEEGELDLLVATFSEKDQK